MERTNQILNLLTQYKTMSIQQMCDLLFCSPSSLRRDLIKLEQTGTVKRIRGGATLVTGNSFEFSSSYRENFNSSQKKYICSIARDFLANGMSLFLDSSSTALQICSVLNELSNITVITNGISTALRLNNSSRINTFLTGGHLLNGSSTVMDESSGEYLDQFNADLAIISCRGISADGVFEADRNQAIVKKHMIKNAQNTILLADSSKFDFPFLHRLCNFSELQAIITDTAPSEEIELSIERSGCELLY